MVKVSVNIVTKNRATLLRRALDSVFLQNYRDFEIVLVDDGSTDNTKDVVYEYLKFGNSITFFKFDKSVGVVKARQKALELSKGEFVAIIDDDDEWISKDKFATQLGLFESNPELVLVGCRGESIDEVTGKVRIWDPPVTDSEIREVMLMRNCFMHPAMVFRKNMAIKVGGYSDKYKFAEDYALVLRLGVVGKMHIVPSKLIRFRVGHEGLTKLNNIRQIKAGISLVLSYKNDYPHYLRALAKWIMHFIVVKFLGQSSWIKLKDSLSNENLT